MRAAERLREIGNNAIPTLLNCLRKGESGESRVIRVFRKTFPSQKFFDTPWSMRQQAVRGFAVLGPEAASALPELVAMLEDPEIASSAAWAMAGLGDAAIPPLLEGLRNRNADARSGCVYALAHTGMSEEIRKAIITAFSDENSDVRYWAIRAIEESFLDREVTDVLGLSRDSDWLVRCSVARVIGSYNSKESYAVLLQLAQDKDADVRTEANEALKSRRSRKER